jgi:hypothetical protein
MDEKKKFARYDEGEGRDDGRREQCAGRGRYGMWEARGCIQSERTDAKRSVATIPKRELSKTRAKKERKEEGEGTRCLPEPGAGNASEERRTREGCACAELLRARA